MKQFAMVFPGQGSQFLGMLAELAKQFPSVIETFNEAADILHYDLWDITQNGPQSRLDQTEITQPVLLAADIAVYRCWCAKTEAQPTVLAGHSLGEYAALVVAEALTFKEALYLVAKRGEYMQAAVPVGVGAMAAIIGLDEMKMQAVCNEAAQGEVVAPANYNSLGQIVIAGHKAAVIRAIDLAKAAGAKIAKLIPVSVPSHSPLMQTATERFTQTLAQVSIQKPKIPVIHNVDVKTHADPQTIQTLLVQQLTSPVRWVETIQEIYNKGVTTIVECGPGKVLAGLIKRIEPTLSILLTDNPDVLQQSATLV